MTTVPCIEIELISLRMASTAAPSPPSLSPRPTQRPAASAAASVTRTRSSARFRSSSSRMCTSSMRRSWHEVGEDGGVTEPIAPGRSGRPACDMLLSLAVLLVPVVILFVVYETAFAGSAPIAVDPSDTWSAARHAGTFPVAQPQGLPARWAVTSAAYGSGTLRVGYVTPARTGLQLVETAAPVDQFLPAELGADARPGNLRTIGGRQWRAYPSVRAGDRALVLVDDGRLVVVVGSAN